VQPTSRDLLIGVVTLLAMIIPTIWTRSKFHLFPMLFGIAAGYAAAIASGEFHANQLLGQMAPGPMSFPYRAAAGISFSLALLPPFLIAALTASLKTVGNTTFCQKVNDSS
jgi:xanthine/uracil permease